MQQRIDAINVSPAAIKALSALQTYVDQSGLDAKLRELIKIRASQINGCAYCVAMHTREQAALAWTEALTLVTHGHVPDAVYEQVRQQFSQKEIVDLTMAVVAINSWNRIAISARAIPQVESAKIAA